MIERTDEPAYLDSQFNANQEYMYIVRSVKLSSGRYKRDDKINIRFILRG